MAEPLALFGGDPPARGAGGDVPPFEVDGASFRPTVVFETYWRFAAERQRMFFRRLRGEWPATDDPILGAHRFTNAYRASDRVSQYLIARVIPGSADALRDLFFRTLIFKVFNSIATWERLEAALGGVRLADYRFAEYDRVLEGARADGDAVYSNAYTMPTPPFGHRFKHSNHLKLIEEMLRRRVPERLAAASSYEAAYDELLSMPSLGRFLAFQFAVDLNYGPLMSFDERALVVAGPGALNGIAKCFGYTGGLAPERVIHAMADQAERWFAFFGIEFPDLWGRPLQPIDVQNLFCEVDKYARVAHPEIASPDGRARIKQRYRVPNRRPFAVAYPASWGLSGERMGVPSPRPV